MAKKPHKDFLLHWRLGKSLAGHHLAEGLHENHVFQHAGDALPVDGQQQGH